MKHINNILTNALENIKKPHAIKDLMKLNKNLFSLQNPFYAEGKHSLLIILQGMDTSGKDVTIRHVFSCFNPQGCIVKSFKTPTEQKIRKKINQPRKKMAI